MNPATGGQSTEQGKLYSTIFLAYLFTSGLFTASIGLLYTTFEYAPLLSLEIRQLLTIQDIVISIIGDIFALGLQLGFPLMGALLISDICVGFVARFAQQLQALAFNLPIKALIDMVFQITYFFVVYDYAAQMFGENIQLVERFMYEMVQIE
jgi:type III secretory pathway component EscT